MSPIRTGLCQNPFQTIPHFSLFDVKTKKNADRFGLRSSILLLPGSYNEMHLKIRFLAFFGASCTYHLLSETKQ